MTLKLASIFHVYFAWAKLNKTVNFLYISSAVCTALCSYLAPAWPQYWQWITEDLYELHQPITGFKICCKRGAEETDQGTYRALGTRQSQKHRKERVEKLNERLIRWQTSNGKRRLDNPEEWGIFYTFCNQNKHCLSTWHHCRLHHWICWSALVLM